jgi:hypothetical protein
MRCFPVVTQPELLAAPDVRVIAYFRLPGVSANGHSGEDLPEWQRVRAVRPRFAGHEQPQLPGELGYSDVRDRAVRDAHAALASEHGIAGFCYVFRWPVGGAADSTLAAIVADDRPGFPFCFCWETVSSHAGAGFGAEEARRALRHTPDQSVAVLRALLPAFAHPGYLRVRGRPLLVVSSPDAFDDVRTIAARWRQESVRAGLGNPLLLCFGGPWGASATDIGFDATLESPPIGGFPEGRREQIAAVTPGFDGDARNYRTYVAQVLVSPRPEHPMFRCIMPSWDATARDGDAARIFVHANAETFGFWAERALDVVRLRFDADERLLFVRAWNEWDAGCHLEPDARHGRANLRALRAALARPPRSVPRRPSLQELRAWVDGGGLAATRVVRAPAQAPASMRGPRVSVVMPAYNHQRYVTAALDSVVAQTFSNLEIIVVDDGSTDSTGAILDDYAARCTTHPLTVVHQPNAGAHEALNHGLALARGEIVALMNSDDLYAPDRLERIIAQMDRRGAGLGFSTTRFIDAEGRDVARSDPYVKNLTKATGEALKAPDPLYVLMYNNVAISTGNFVFRRELLERTGGFCALQVCHDWDFLLAASYAAPLTMVDAPLYLYRLHGTNTFAKARVEASFELEQLLSTFFSRIGEHPLLQDPQRAAHFRDHVRAMGMSGYLR